MFTDVLGQEKCFPSKMISGILVLVYPVHNGLASFILYYRMRTEHLHHNQEWGIYTYLVKEKRGFKVLLVQVVLGGILVTKEKEDIRGLKETKESVVLLANVALLVPGGLRALLDLMASLVFLEMMVDLD